MNLNDRKMEAENSNRTRIIGLRLTPEEYTRIEKRWKASDCRKLSDYARRCLFNKPIKATYRNKSTDDLMDQIIVLHRELNAIGNNFNQTVKKLHTLGQANDVKQWSFAYQMDRKNLFGKVEEIKLFMQKMMESWLQ